MIFSFYLHRTMFQKHNHSCSGVRLYKEWRSFCDTYKRRNRAKSDVGDELTNSTEYYSYCQATHFYYTLSVTNIKISSQSYSRVYLNSEEIRDILE